MSGSTAMRAKERVPSGTFDQTRGGEPALPSQEKVLGHRAPVGKGRAGQLDGAIQRLMVGGAGALGRAGAEQDEQGGQESYKTEGDQNPEGGFHLVSLCVEVPGTSGVSAWHLRSCEGGSTSATFFIARSRSCSESGNRRLNIRTKHLFPVEQLKVTTIPSAQFALWGVF